MVNVKLDSLWRLGPTVKQFWDVVGTGFGDGSLSDQWVISPFLMESIGDLLGL